MSILTAPSTSETGKRIANTAMALRHGPITPDTRATMSAVRNTVSVPSSGLMAHLTSGNFIITTSMVKVFILGPTTENTRENGEPTRCMARAPSPGLTAESMSESTPRIRRRATASSSGPMVDATEENGLMVSSTERAHSSPVPERKSMESGKTEKE